MSRLKTPPIQLLSRDGAHLRFLEVPNLAAPDLPDTILTDVEVLTPDRLVRYLGREVSRDFFTNLEQALLDGARLDYPEKTVPTVQDDRSGLAITYLESTPESVVIQVLIREMVTPSIPDIEDTAFEVSRVSLIDAAQVIREEWR
ncbi:MAG TPA: hypothetical protein PLC19_01205 [Marmoricola sp.]|nr:hypothetical protein [Marmoricola sp.]